MRTGDPLPGRIQVVEVGPRDGLQAETRRLPLEKKVALLDRLADAGHTVIEATSFVSPTAVPHLADAEDLMRALRRRPGIRYLVLVPNARGLERAMEVGVGDIAIFVSASETYSRKNLRRGREEAMAANGPVVRAAKDAGIRVRGYLSMAIADPWDGRRPRWPLSRCRAVCSILGVTRSRLVTPPVWERRRMWRVSCGHISQPA